MRTNKRRKNKERANQQTTIRQAKTKPETKLVQVWSLLLCDPTRSAMCTREFQHLHWSIYTLALGAAFAAYFASLVLLIVAV